MCAFSSHRFLVLRVLFYSSPLLIKHPYQHTHCCFLFLCICFSVLLYRCSVCFFVVFTILTMAITPPQKGFYHKNHPPTLHYSSLEILALCFTWNATHPMGHPLSILFVRLFFTLPVCRFLWKRVTQCNRYCFGFKI